MKLLTKLTLYITISKTVIVILFIVLLPWLAGRVASAYTDRNLRQQRDRVLSVIERNGIESYLQGDSSYGSYTMLKEEYISLEHMSSYRDLDTLETSQRVVETDTLNYRILIYSFQYNGQPYVLEAGRTISSINAYNRPLQRLALYVLAGLILLTLIVDLLYTRVLLRPMGKIIATKLLNRKFPFREKLDTIQTSTSDFQYLDQSLIQLMQQVHEAFEKEREFTSNASHELMTPISILQSKMENMLDDELPDAVQDKLNGMMQTLSRLKKIVRSLLLISRIENDQYQLSDTVKVGDILIEIGEELQDRFKARNIDFNIQVSKARALSAVNRDLFFQLLFNIINNAIRYNKDGGTIRVTDLVEKDDYLINISDTGIGIAAQELATIFGRFKKSSEAGTESYGLGLSIVQSIANYHGWTISVHSEKNEGTTFSIRIPGHSN